MPAGAQPRSAADVPSPAVTEREARWACGLLPQLGGVALQGFVDTFGSVSAAWAAAASPANNAAAARIRSSRIRLDPVDRALQHPVLQMGDDLCAGISVAD